MLSSANQQRMDRFRSCGSLPLKKRRVSLVEPSKSSSFLPYNKSNLQNEVATSEYLMPSMTERSSELTALSILAAAAATSDEMSCTAAVLPSSMVMMHEQPESFFCHAKTSRGNFFCKRQPCYKGTNYCKQHFCQIEAKKVSEDEEESSKAAYTVGQDKRCTGDDNEVRCFATSTRGRTCAYIAVNYTKYCYLHADYDTNSLPRRTSKLLSNDSLSKPRRRRMTAKLADKHAAAMAPIPPTPPVRMTRSGRRVKPRQRYIVSPSPTDRFKSSDEEPDTPKPNASMSDLVELLLVAAAHVGGHGWKHS